MINYYSNTDKVYPEYSGFIYLPLSASERHAVLKPHASGNQIFKGNLRKALFRNPLKCLAMLTLAAGFISLMISSALLFKNWFIASPKINTRLEGTLSFKCEVF